MPTLQWHKDYQQLLKLKFCYLCGKRFVAEDKTNDDHVPPKSAFHRRDRSPPIKLKTHIACHEPFSDTDKKVGQLISLRRGERPNSMRDRALQFGVYPHYDMVAVENLDINAMVWRWIAAFHAALYNEPLIGRRGNIQTPFPRAEKTEYGIKFHRLPDQHATVVETIKTNRAYNNLDRLISNNNALRYECVWCQFDHEDRWFCMCALDIYGWKDLGSDTVGIPARGCTGIYLHDNGAVPALATRDRRSRIIVPNYNKLDPFSP